MAITLDGTTGITTPDVIATSQSSNFVTTGNISATDLTLTGAASATDLTLSGGIYLGGIGAGNYLDDYEEGTWTPIAVGGTSGVGGSQLNDGFYRKLGSVVTVWLETSFTKNTISGGFQISGLPFTASTMGDYGSGNAVNAAWSFSGDVPRHGYAINGTTTLGFWDDATNYITDADLNTGAGNRMIFTLTYFTAS